MTVQLDKSKTFAFDIETYASCFTLGVMNWETGEYHDFEISRFRDDGLAMFNFFVKIKQESLMTISFNGMRFDMPVVHYFIALWINGLRDPMKIVEKIFDYSQWTIHEAPRFNRVKEPHWIDIDLYKINHYDNRAKSTSLKKIQVFLKMDTIEELPHPLDDPNLSESEITDVREYMHHDVLTTKLFADYCFKEIEFRFGMIEKFGTAVINYSDSKIGSELMNKELIDKMGYDKVYKMVNGRREPIQSHYPNGFKVSELIFPYIRFESPEGNAMLNFFKSQTLTGTTGAFDELDLNDIGELANYVEHVLTNTEINKQNTRDYLSTLRLTIKDVSKSQFNKEHELVVAGVFDKKGYPLPPRDENNTVSSDYARMGKYFKVYWDYITLSPVEFNSLWPENKETFTLPTKLKKLNLKFGNIVHYWGTGGLHSSVAPGTYRSCDEYQLIDADVVSFYPSLSIENFLAPKQYSPEVWVDTYGDMKTKRVSYAKGTPENKALKLALNSTYGNSGNQFSPIHDPAYTVSTCISGQLTLTMLMEQWLKIPGLKLMSANTDGANAAVPRQYIPQFIEICAEFEKITNLELEFALFNTMYHRDVNNFVYDVEEDGLKINDMQRRYTE